MPEKRVTQRARRDKRQGKSASTQAGEYVRAEMHHIRRGKHGARSSKQAIAIGLSKARRAGVKLPRKRRGAASAKSRRNAQRASKRGNSRRSQRPSAKRSLARLLVLRRAGRAAASHRALSRQARSSARRRGARARSAAARRAARTRARARR